MLSAALFVAIVLSGAGLSGAQIVDDRPEPWDLSHHMRSEYPWSNINRRWRYYPTVTYLRPDFVQQNSANEENGMDSKDGDDMSRLNSDKRSAVGAAINAGRRRRQPAPALGKAFTPYVGVGVLNDVGYFLDTLRDNLETFASLSPEERSSLFDETPTVVQASSGGGSGRGARWLHALRPLRQTNKFRSYNRRSDNLPSYPAANNHDPGLLWTGLGR